MRNLVALATLALLLVAQHPAAAAKDVGEVRNFGPDLQTTCPFPEGVAVDGAGNVYASSLNFAATTGPANICVLDAHGNMVNVITVPPITGGVARLLGMLFVPGEGLYVGDVGGGRVLRVDVRTEAVTTVATGFGAPNAFARDRGGNLFVSDSFAGSITRIAPDGAITRYVYADQLQPRTGEFPPFGANGIAFDHGERHLYVAVTSRDEIYRIDHAHGELGAIERFARGDGGGALDGADGIGFDAAGNLYVCSNQSDQVTVLDVQGNVAARVIGDGVNAFNSPASLVFDGRLVYVTNLALFKGPPHKLSVFSAPVRGAP